MDLLIFSGALADDTRDRLVGLLLGMTEDKIEVDRVMEWIKTWRDVRTKQDEKGTDSGTKTE